MTTHDVMRLLSSNGRRREVVPRREKSSLVVQDSSDGRGGTGTAAGGAPGPRLGRPGPGRGTRRDGPGHGLLPAAQPVAAGGPAGGDAHAADATGRQDRHA